MLEAMNRRNFLQIGIAAGAAAMLPRAAHAQAASAAGSAAQTHASDQRERRCLEPMTAKPS